MVGDHDDLDNDIDRLKYGDHHCDDRDDHDDHAVHDDLAVDNYDDQVRHIASEGLDLGLPLRGQTALALAISLGKVMPKHFGLWLGKNIVNQPTD